MASEIITQLNGGVALTATASGDKLPITDVSDTTEAASGTTKPIAISDLLRIIFTSFALSGDISPAQITSNQNDYNPTGLADASVLRLSTDASRNITSIAGGADGRVLIIHNVGSNAIVLKDDDGATGTAANRFALSGDVTLTADQCAILQYDSTSSRWRLLSTSSALGGAPSGSAGGDLTGTYPNPRVAQVNDANGNELLKFGTTASAVNEVTITNKATGNAPTISATGGDTDVSLNLVSKGAGVIQANGVNVLLESLEVFASDLTTALAAGTGKGVFFMPYAMTVLEVFAGLATPQTSGSIFTVDINEAGTTILSTKITIDNGEDTSLTAATPPVISDVALAKGAKITIDIDQIGDGTAKGLVVVISGVRG